MTKAAGPILRNFHDQLAAAYGPQQWWPAQTPLEVIVGAYLTQNTSWRSVERSIANLVEHGVMNLNGLRAIQEDELRVLIRPSGYMVRKAAAIKAFVSFLDRDHGSSLARLAAQPTSVVRRQLLDLPGVGEETADAILLYALLHPVAVVDEYLRRIADRHGLAGRDRKYGEVQRLVDDAFANDPAEIRLPLYNEFHALVVAVGKRHCGPKPRCEGCPLAAFQ
ncbi:MAG: endonuclease related protein [Acidobacteriaceae bacterium]|jgi:endonuclease-3 related protein|nr:endonuclease related protein [Acidobacteriaceae bacterium]